MEMQSYYAKLLGELNEQRKRDFFCDCSIIVEGRIFKAHKNILFANSGYFRALLIHYIQDSGRHSTASLDIVTSEAFSIILDFLYSGKLDLCGENVIEVMSAASYLQMTDVVNFCKTYIRSSLDICRKIEREAAFYQADSGSASSAREGTSYGSKSQCSASVSSLQEKERISDCQRDPPCGECSSCHPLELVVRDPVSSDSPDDVNSSLPKGVEPKVEFDSDEVEVEVGERLPQYQTPLSLEQMEEGLHGGQAMDLACNNYHMKQFLEALLRNSSAQRKDDVVHHFVRGFEGRPEDAGVAMSSMMDIHSDWYGEDTAAGHLRFHCFPKRSTCWDVSRWQEYLQAAVSGTWRRRRSYPYAFLLKWTIRIWAFYLLMLLMVLLPEDARNEKYKVLIKEQCFHTFRLTDGMNTAYFQVSTSVPVILVPFTADRG
ncbi:zinc finger and BTB domain-containing protein 8B isoform X4 [Falco peregrinus]|uniref:zinc finger and BTB domain-containing protein 8B isoform X4 n=1 Tax=Falco peregrinus TaxID=8954 RepID=UPI0024783AD9|nr:zinc finger and BTB domain-containing protein 8B isoform X4 [Falco peregrinus]